MVMSRRMTRKGDEGRVDLFTLVILHLFESFGVFYSHSLRLYRPFHSRDVSTSILPSTGMNESIPSSKRARKFCENR